MKTLTFTKANIEPMQLFEELGKPSSLCFDRATNTIQIVVSDGADEMALKSIVEAHNPKVKDKKAEYAAAANKSDFLAAEFGYK